MPEFDSTLAWVLVAMHRPQRHRLVAISARVAEADYERCAARHKTRGICTSRDHCNGAYDARGPQTPVADLHLAVLRRSHRPALYPL